MRPIGPVSVLTTLPTLTLGLLIISLLLVG